MKRNIIAMASCVAFIVLSFGCSPPGPRGPGGAIYHHFAYDSTHKLILFTSGFDGGLNPLKETWTFDPAKRRWARLSDEEKLFGCSGTLGFDAKAGVFVFFINARLRSNRRMDLDEVSETWTIDLGTGAWKQLATKGQPPAGLLGCSMVYDASAGNFILFGGWFPTTGNFYNETWSFDYAGLEWKRFEPTSSPPGRNYAEMAWDEKAGKAVLFGGDSGGDKDPRTWLFDPKTDAWTSVEAADGPEQLDYASLTFVPPLGGCLLFGGAKPDNESVRNGTWLFDSASKTWKELKPANRPSARGWHATVWDPGRKVLWLYGGGTNRNGATDELWYFDPAKGDWIRVKRPKS